MQPSSGGVICEIENKKVRERIANINVILIFIVMELKCRGLKSEVAIN